MPPTAKNLPKIRKKGDKEGNNQENDENQEEKGTNWADSFTLPLLIDRAGYVTGGSIVECSFFRAKVTHTNDLMWGDRTVENHRHHPCLTSSPLTLVKELSHSR